MTEDHQTTLTEYPAEMKIQITCTCGWKKDVFVGSHDLRTLIQSEISGHRSVKGAGV